MPCLCFKGNNTFMVYARRLKGNNRIDDSAGHVREASSRGVVRLAGVSPCRGPEWSRVSRSGGEAHDSLEDAFESFRLEQAAYCSKQDQRFTKLESLVTSFIWVSLWLWMIWVRISIFFKIGFEDRISPDFVTIRKPDRYRR
ncbi:hypothetical protein MANES_16G122650v8 [Manihot esculenta]|uniref:Uncharacterized protein n=1 Tax=Manihot esculenta TaxID=3983 RepID=A0ACB7G9A2_MANES|nr:hypothetical protein MANES_16G122650v8 [Manihot esculenta]